MASSDTAARTVSRSAEREAKRSAPKPPYAPPSDERKIRVCSGFGRAAIVPRRPYPRWSSISAAVPEALSFAPGPVPMLSRWATKRIASELAPGMTVTRFRRRTVPSPGICSSQASSTVGQPIEREPVLDPCGRSERALGARLAIREVARELGRELRRRRAVEGRWERRRRERPGRLDREGEDEQRERRAEGWPRERGGR